MTTSRARKLAGSMAKANGQSFEAQLELLAAAYARHGLLELCKRYEPYKRVSGGAGSVFKAVYTSKSGCDFEIWLSDGRAGHIEAKSREAERISKDALDEVQQAQLQRRVDWGQLALVLVRLQGIWYMIHYSRWNEGDRQSHNHKQLEEIGYKLKVVDNIPDLLTPLFGTDI